MSYLGSKPNTSTKKTCYFIVGFLFLYGSVAQLDRASALSGIKNRSALEEILDVESLKFGETLTSNVDGNPEPSLK
jgi:hypothetical protein